jgi:hypothetical protein
LVDGGADLAGDGCEHDRNLRLSHFERRGRGPT